MLKFYTPDGHLEAKTMELLKKAGFDIKISERNYKPTIDDKDIMLKRLRPQDFPFLLALGKGDIGICGLDILTEFKITYKDLADNVVELMDLKLGWTKLVAAISEEVIPDVKTIDDFAKYAEERSKNKDDVVIVSEYPAIAREYLERHNIKAIVRRPAGKTEAWLIPPDNEADMIIDTTETGTTLKANRCIIIDTLLESTAHIVANKDSLNSEKKEKIMEIVDLIKGAMSAENKVNAYMNVFEPKNLENVLNLIKQYSSNPTISRLDNGGYDIFIIIDAQNLKYILPKLKKEGASEIAVSDVRMLL
ncbi:MAG: ATP phosphoribosyltransferase [Candidatus Altiarchaeales archaeon HGW-Altiarchaeales-1]|nr:MAG: ATP phosphoribosyltransferase [Candidatus Altiarchaeales archaeon HGW-Altiarchaeales-1]